MEQVPCYLIYEWYLLLINEGCYHAIHKNLEWGEEYNWDHLTIPEEREDEWNNAEHYKWESPEAFKDWYDYWKQVSAKASCL
jgi:hypothetical protein